MQDGGSKTQDDFPLRRLGPFNVNRQTRAYAGDRRLAQTGGLSIFCAQSSWCLPQLLSFLGAAGQNDQRNVNGLLRTRRREDKRKLMRSVRFCYCAIRQDRVGNYPHDPATRAGGMFLLKSANRPGSGQRSDQEPPSEGRCRLRPGLGRAAQCSQSHKFGSLTPRHLARAIIQRWSSEIRRRTPLSASISTISATVAP